MSIETVPIALRMRCDTCGRVCGRTGETPAEAGTQAAMVGWWLWDRRPDGVKLDECDSCAFARLMEAKKAKARK